MRPSLEVMIDQLLEQTEAGVFGPNPGSPYDALDLPVGTKVRLIQDVHNTASGLAGDYYTGPMSEIGIPLAEVGDIGTVEDVATGQYLVSFPKARCWTLAIGHFVVIG